MGKPNVGAPPPPNAQMKQDSPVGAATGKTPVAPPPNAPVTDPKQVEPEFQKPKLNQGPVESAKKNVANVSTKDGAIEVIATAKGFFGGHRRDVDERFKIPSMKYFSGLWMKLADPEAERERKRKLKEEREKLRGV